VFGASALLGASGVIPGGLGLPSATAGWIALGCLVLLYGAAFSTLFICMPRLNIARNAPVMNMEPVAGMLLGWLVLGQLLAPMQILGGLIVVGGIVLLAYRKN
jgi:drug/metabolite transporter (DMT)-like permease